MEKRLRTNLLLVAALATLAVIVWLLPSPEKADVSFRVFDQPPARSIRVFESGTLKLALEHDNEWQLRAPINWKADRFHVDALLAALQSPVAARYPLSEVDLAALGLDETSLRIEVDGEWLRVGGRSAIGARRYLQKCEYVYLVEDVLSYQLSRSPLDYASRKVVQDAKSLSAITLPGGQRISRTGVGWRISPPMDAIGSDDLQRVVDAWQQASALKVTVANSVPRDGAVEIAFENGETQHLGVELTDDSLLLTRDEPPLTFHMPREIADDLLQIDNE